MCGKWWGWNPPKLPDYYIKKLNLLQISFFFPLKYWFFLPRNAIKELNHSHCLKTLSVSWNGAQCWMGRQSQEVKTFQNTSQHLSANNRYHCNDLCSMGWHDLCSNLKRICGVCLLPQHDWWVPKCRATRSAELWRLRVWQVGSYSHYSLSVQSTAEALRVVVTSGKPQWDKTRCWQGHCWTISPAWAHCHPPSTWQCWGKGRTWWS